MSTLEFVEPMIRRLPMIRHLPCHEANEADFR